MNQTSGSTRHSPPSGERPLVEGHRSRVEALLSLLGDDSPLVQEAVRREIERLGRVARPALMRARHQGDARTRGRARQLLLEADRREAARRLVRYAARVDVDLERGLLLLDRFCSPEEDKLPHRRVLDAFGEELRRRIQRRKGGLERAMVLVEYMSNELGYAGPDTDYHHPDHIHLGRTLETKRGLPLTLCAVYAFVARRAGLDAGLLPFPGHVLLRIADGGERAIVDPFGGGRVLTEANCLSYLAGHGLPYRAEWFRRASDHSMFLRQVLNLMRSLEGRGRLAERTALLPVFRVLAGPEAPVPELVPQRER